MKDMDAEYILPKLLKLCTYWYFGEPFGFVAENGKYVFGTKSEDGKILNRNIVTKAVAIFITCQFNEYKEGIIEAIEVKRKRRRRNEY